MPRKGAPLITMRGARRNDISQQMRNIARQMTSEEMNQAAHYYASQPSEVVHATAR